MLKIIKYFLAVVAAAFCVIFGLGFFMFSSSPSCGEDSDAVAYARSLSQERLEKLYFDFKQLLEDPETPLGGYTRMNREEPFPKQFEDLNVVKIRPARGYILVQGCMDHGVVLGFGGLDQNEDGKIVLSWGEIPPDSGSETLWTQY